MCRVVQPSPQSNPGLFPSVPNKKWLVFLQPFPSLPPPTPSPRQPLMCFLSTDFPFVDDSCSERHPLCGLCVWRLSDYNIFEVPPRCSECQNAPLFLPEYYSTARMDPVSFIHSPVTRHLGAFHFRAIITNTAGNIHVTCVFISLG